MMTMTDTAIVAPAPIPGERTLLIVEDDKSFLTRLARAMERRGFAVSTAETVAEGLLQVEKAPPFYAVVDMRLGDGVNGLTVARRLKSSDDFPLLFLTSASGIDDVLAAFDAGGDDYIVKPFVMAELLARMRAALRRNGREARSVLELGDLVVDESAHSVVRGGNVVELTHREFSLLVMLCRHSGMVLSKVQLLANVWGFEHYDLNVVEVHVSALRKKLEENGPRLIQTVRGVGYVLRPVAPVEGL